MRGLSSLRDLLIKMYDDGAQNEEHDRGIYMIGLGTNYNE